MQVSDFGKECTVKIGDQSFGVTSCSLSYDDESTVTAEIEAIALPTSYVGVDIAEAGGGSTVGCEMIDGKWSFYDVNNEEKGEEVSDYYVKAQDRECDAGYDATSLAVESANSKLSADEKLLREMNVVTLEGTLTHQGRELLSQILFEANKDEVVKELKRIKNDRKVAKN